MCINFICLSLHTLASELAVTSGSGDPGGSLTVRYRAMPAGRRHRRLTLAPGCGSIAVATDPHRPSSFGVLSRGEEAEADEGSDADVPIESALDVLESYSEPESSSVIRKERRMDEELVQEFWTEMGYPTPASRFWEKPISPSAGKAHEFSVVVCRDDEERSVQGTNDVVSSSSRVIAGAPTAEKKDLAAAPSFPVRWRPRAGYWRGPCPPRQITPLPVFGHFLLKAGWTPEEEESTPASPSVQTSAEAGSREQLRWGGPRLHGEFSWAGLGEALRFLWVDRRRHAINAPSSSSIVSAALQTRPCIATATLPQSSPTLSRVDPGRGPGSTSPSPPSPVAFPPSTPSPAAASSSRSSSPVSRPGPSLPPIAAAYLCHGWGHPGRPSFAEVAAKHPLAMSG
jgi:hypothetical protein